MAVSGFPAPLTFQYSFNFMILDCIPYSTNKNLGKAYNDTMLLVGDDDHICFRDGDTCWLTPDYGVHLAEYVRLYPDAILTCWTNRINEKSEQQSKMDGIRDDERFTSHLKNAIDYKKRRGLTQAAAADIAGSSQSRIAKMETADASVSIDLMVLIG